MEKEMNEMKVYVVFGGFEYEGDCWEQSGKVFMKREDAEVYAESLKSEGNYEYVEVREEKVN